MRTFISINAPQQIGDHLVAIQQTIAKNNSQTNIKWVEPENFHICLQFLGNLSELEINNLADRLGHIIRFIPFKLRLTNIDCFPNHFEPRVIVINAEEPTGKLFILQKQIRNFLLARKYQLDLKPFKPHLTLGRLKYQTSFLNLPKQIERLEFDVHLIDLMKSELTKYGPIYQSITQYGE
ncbi:RNA 2',3'-cyclic phosphodiesterase [Candidatus Falkowbacteria bacterium]|nr:RNA 2',3'-cyclic phosphodiesterase [Candidatus Falkowbacteria bacterium]